MTPPSRVFRRVGAWVTAAAITAVSPSAFAQAWVGDRNSLSASLDYNYTRSDRVIAKFADRAQSPPVDLISSHNLAFGVEYTVLDKLAVTASLPLVTTLFFGDPEDPMQTFQPHGRYDDGNYHTTLTDVRLGARYMVLLDPVAISPHLGVSVPVTDYETVGFAAAGRGLRALHAGASIGRYFQSGPLTDLYLHLHYEFSLVEKYETALPETAEFGQNRSDIKTSFGYYITEGLEVNLATDIRIAHGGFLFDDIIEAPPVLEAYHDPLLAETFVLVGVGTSYQVTDALRLTAFFRYWLWGEQTRDANIAGGGISWDVM